MTALVVAAAVVLAAGYGLGRWRPWMRLGDWANWQVRFHVDRWNASYPRQAFLAALLLLTDPIVTVHAWQHRNDPPRREPALQMDPGRAAKRHAEREDQQ